MKGAYVTFLDSDDLLSESAVEDMLSCAYETNADIVEGGFARIDLDGNSLEVIEHKEGAVKNSSLELYGYGCGKIFKKSIFNKVSFPQGYWYEDSLMRQIIYPLTHNMYGINKTVYYYRENPNGITGSDRKSRKCIDSLWITLQLFYDRKNFGLVNTQEYYDYLLKMIVTTYHRTEEMHLKYKKAIFTLFSDLIIHNFAQFQTDQYLYKDLEFAIKNNNFHLYELYFLLRV